MPQPKLGRISSSNFPDMPPWLRGIYDERLLKGAMRNITFLGWKDREANLANLIYFWDIIEAREGYWRVTFPNATKPAYYYNLTAAQERMHRSGGVNRRTTVRHWSGERWLAVLKVKRDVAHENGFRFKLGDVQAMKIYAEKNGLKSWQSAVKYIILNTLNEEGYYQLAQERGLEHLEEIP